MDCHSLSESNSGQRHCKTLNGLLVSGCSMHCKADSLGVDASCLGFCECALQQGGSKSLQYFSTPGATSARMNRISKDRDTRPCRRDFEPRPRILVA
jgi:hypothetical protein